MTIEEKEAKQKEIEEINILIEKRALGVDDCMSLKRLCIRKDKLLYELHQPLILKK